jgi:hypothetical protein
MIDAKKLGPAGSRYLGTPYSEMDCQAFWERVLKDCGIKMDLGGSNSWYRYMMKHGWCGTPEECVKTFGGIPVGATLYIRKDVSESTPAQFRDDGIGDITHMGIFTGMTGKEMVQIALDAGVSHADKYNYGDGAINSSSSRGGVCTSKFAGKSISGGWNRVGLWLESIVYDGTTPPEPGPEPKPEPTTAMVYAENDFPVKMREKPSTSCKLYDPVPCGSIVEVLAKDCSTDNAGNVWSQISYGSREGWYMMSKFLLFAGGSCIVIIPNLSMEQAEELVKQYPGAYIEMAKG